MMEKEHSQIPPEHRKSLEISWRVLMGEMHFVLGNGTAAGEDEPTLNYAAAHYLQNSIREDFTNPQIEYLMQRCSSFLDRIDKKVFLPPSTKSLSTKFWRKMKETFEPPPPERTSEELTIISRNYSYAESLLNILYKATQQRS